MNLVRTAGLLTALCLWAAGARAHDIRPIYLQLDETAPGQVSVLLKLPVFRDAGLAAASPVLPAGCREFDHAPAREGQETLIRAWRLDCDDALAGGSVRIEGFSKLAPDALVVARFADGRESHYVLSEAHPSALLQPPNPGAAAPGLSAYLPIGIEHILSGFDHLLFVLGLILVTWRAGAGARVLLATVTAFTVAHSITLAAAVLGHVALPGASVETLIALSILVLAVELARSLKHPHQRPQGLSFRAPWLVAFAFGLLHGFGFAGALQETGLPPQAQGWALALFNIGVEVGQLLFIAAVFGLHRLARAFVRTQRPQLRAATALTWFLGVVSAAWAIDRALNLFAA